MRISDWSSDVCSSDLGSACPSFGRTAQAKYWTASENHAVRRGLHRIGPAHHRRSRSPSTGERLSESTLTADSQRSTRAPRRAHQRAHHGRSEEHTSELQSLMRISYAVFCLKKKH